MKMKIIIMAIFLIMILPMVIATEDDITQLSETYNYKFPCYNNGTFCGSSATCNITVLDPTMQVLINGQDATNQGNYFNYTIQGSLLNNPGKHNVMLECTDGPASNTNNDYFLVTQSNFVYDTGLSFLTTQRMILLISVLMIIGGFVYIFNYDDSNSIGSILASLGSMLMMVQGVDFIRNGFDNVISSSTSALGMIMILLGGLILILMSYMKYKDIF